MYSIRRCVCSLGIQAQLVEVSLSKVITMEGWDSYGEACTSVMLGTRGYAFDR